MKKKLAIVTTHPIQYNAPVFKALHESDEIDIQVFYTWGDGVLEKKYDPGFNKEIKWDIPLLDGYQYHFTKNVSKKAGSHHFYGINNPSLIIEIEQWGADAVLIFGWNFKSHLKCLRYFKGKIPIIFRGDSTLLNSNNNYFRNILRKLWLRFIYRNIDIALSAGNANSQYFLEYGVKEHQIVCAPHAVDNERFEKCINKDIRKKLLIPEDSVVFLYAGKFEEIKNIDILMRAFISLDDESYLILVGSGKLESYFKKLVSNQEKIIRDKIKMLDFVNQSDIPDFYHSADVFVLPSKSETWGLSVNEAMAAGKAVIVSQTCGCHLDLVQPGVNGFVVTPNDELSLADAMRKIQIGRAYVEMGKESRIIISNFTFSNIAKAILNILYP